MSTLKICVDQTTWICGIKSLVEVGHFTVPQTKKTEDSEKDEQGNAIYAAAHEHGYMKGIGVINIAHFEELHEKDVHGVAVKVQREDRLNQPNELWLIPARSAFLMSDEGSTIDRI
jgi:hypothetical protein